MFLSWLRRGRRSPSATLEALYLAPSAGEPMQAVTEVEAIAGRGLKGDRYAAGNGHWQLIEACQVTLISTQDLQQAKHKAPAPIAAALDRGAHRRNLVVSGLKNRQLEGRAFAIGTAVFRYVKPRPPCGYIDGVAGAGMGKALVHYSGICIEVVRGGRLAVGDDVRLLDDDAAP